MITSLCAVGFVLFTFSLSHDQLTFQNRATADNQHLVSVYVDGEKHTITTQATTVAAVLDQFNVKPAKGDVIEPSPETVIDQPVFNINVYRGMPSTVIDEGKKTTVITGHRSPRQIAADAGLQLYPEDIATLSRVDDFLTDQSVGPRVDITRAKPIQIILAGQVYNVRTQKTTARELFAEKGFTLQPQDVSDVDFDAPLQKGQRIIINRFSQTVLNQIEPIPYGEQTETDPNQPVGFSATKQVGHDGQQIVHYVVDMKDGFEIDRHVLDTTKLEDPVDTIIVKGSKKYVPQAATFSDSNSARDFIFSHESGGRLDAVNGLGCIGLGQSCNNGGSQPALAIACPNWQTDQACQLSFWDAYANSRYGGWEGAYNFWVAHGWW